MFLRCSTFQTKSYFFKKSLLRKICKNLLYRSVCGKLTLTNVALVPLVAVRSVVAVFTLVTVDTLGVVLAVLTHATALVVLMYVQGQSLLIYCLVVHTLICVAETVACCNLITISALKIHNSDRQHI